MTSPPAGSAQRVPSARCVARRLLVLTAGLAAGCSSSGASHEIPDAHSDAQNVIHLDAGTMDAKGKPVDASSAAANGTLGAWQSLSPMPLPRANHCAVAAAGYLVVIGGNYEADGGTSFIDIDAVHVAAIRADGTLGAWSQAGSTPSPVSGCTAAANGSTIYLVDGIYDDMADQGHAFSAELSASGTLGSWTALGALPNTEDAFSSDAWFLASSAGTLLAMGSTLTATAALELTTVPTTGAWSADTWLPGFLGRPEYAFTGSYVYALGGYLSNDGGNPTVTTATGAAVESDGKVGTPFVTEALPSPITFGRAVAVDAWVFVVGGKSSLFGPGESGTYSAKVGASGQLGTWSAQAALPEGRTDMALTLSGDFLYLTGGGYMGPGVASVFSARVRF
jgi:hypothetical protein